MITSKTLESMKPQLILLLLLINRGGLQDNSIQYITWKIKSKIKNKINFQSYSLSIAETTNQQAT